MKTLYNITSAATMLALIFAAAALGSSEVVKMPPKVFSVKQQITGACFMTSFLGAEELRAISDELDAVAAGGY